MGDLEGTRLGIASDVNPFCAPIISLVLLMDPANEENPIIVHCRAAPVPSLSGVCVVMPGPFPEEVATIVMAGDYLL